MHRRQLLICLAASPLLARSGFLTAQATEARAERISRIISEYSAQGTHRTGTQVDAQSAQWLAENFQELGLQAQLDPMELQRVNVLQAEVRFGQHALQGVPLFDCNYTDAVGISGTLGTLGSSADIGVIMLPPSTASARHTQLHEARLTGTHRGIIIVSDLSYPADGVATLNAEDFRNPFGPPVVQVANGQWDALQNAMAQNATATLIAHCDRSTATAFNVSAKIDGSDANLAPMVIMTPRSSWWQSASERGGGIALFIELARDLLGSAPQRDILFTANTGHELSHLGLDQYLHANPDLIRDAHVWIHLGANFAARGSAVRLQYSSAHYRDMTHRLLQDMNLQPGTETPLGSRPLGEARNIFDGGGNFISILGNNPLFHHPQDLWPDAVDLPTTTRWVEAFSRLIIPLGRA